MANKKLTELSAISTLANTDLVYVVVNPGGAPVSYKITLANLLRNIPDGSSAAPAMAFTDEQTLGFYRSGAGAINLIGGTITFSNNVIMTDGKYIGQAAGPQVLFDDTNNFLEISGCKVGIANATPGTELDITGTLTVTDIISPKLKKIGIL